MHPLDALINWMTGVPTQAQGQAQAQGVGAAPMQPPGWLQNVRNLMFPAQGVLSAVANGGPKPGGHYSNNPATAPQGYSWQDIQKIAAAQAAARATAGQQ